MIVLNGDVVYTTVLVMLLIVSGGSWLHLLARYLHMPSDTVRQRMKRYDVRDHLWATVIFPIIFFLLLWIQLVKVLV